MRMSAHWLIPILFLWCFSNASIQGRENTEFQKKIETSYPTMAPNSKFLNPHVDDATNLQFAIAAFGDDAKIPEDNKSKTSKTSAKLSENWDLKASSRESKSLDDWKIIPFLNSLLKGNKNYKFKNA